MKRIGIDINDVIRAYTMQFGKIYEKFINPSFDITYEEIDDFDFLNVFPFKNENDEIDATLLNQFKYVDYAFEIFARAEATHKMLPAEFNLWVQNTLRNFDEDDLPEVFIFSPFEMNLSIQATLSFLSRIGIRVREIHFPIDSMKMWDNCDIMITANPNLLNATPDGKTSIKINMPYNKEANSTLSYDSMIDVIRDDKTINDLILKKDE